MKIKSGLVSFFTFFALFAYFLPLQAISPPKKVQWMTNYDEAVNLSKTTQRPIVLFFTGSDWCGWCNKLEKEVFDTPDFSGAAGEKFIFVKIDFPMKTKLEPSLHAQNEKLQKKYAIRSYPTIVLLDSDQQPVGMTGYKAGGGKQYAQHLMKMANDYSAYKQQMRRLGAKDVSGKELKRLYQKATELGLKNDQNLIIRVGMDSDLSQFFIAERYRYLVAEGERKSDEALKLRKSLLETDPENKNFVHYQIAVIDFESCSEEVQKKKMSPDAAIEPILSYIRGSGSEDKQNLWRLNMVISQLFLDQNRLTEALKYAKDSYKAAPVSIQPDIARTIANIQKQIAIESAKS